MKEFGSSQPIRFAQGELYDGKGAIIKCKCGKPASQTLIGKESYMARCDKCSQNEGTIIVFSNDN